MRIEKTDIIHSLYNATNVGWDEINNKWFTHNKTYKSRNLEIDSIKGTKKLNLFKILYDSGKNKDLTNPIFIKIIATSY